MVNEMEREAYLTTKIDKPMWEQEENGGSQLGANVEIPNDLVSRNFVGCSVILSRVNFQNFIWFKMLC